MSLFIHSFCFKNKSQKVYPNVLGIIVYYLGAMAFKSLQCMTMKSLTVHLSSSAVVFLLRVARRTPVLVKERQLRTEIKLLIKCWIITTVLKHNITAYSTPHQSLATNKTNSKINKTFYEMDFHQILEVASLHPQFPQLIMGHLLNIHRKYHTSILSFDWILQSNPIQSLL